MFSDDFGSLFRLEGGPAERLGLSDGQASVQAAPLSENRTDVAATKAAEMAIDWVKSLRQPG